MSTSGLSWRMQKQQKIDIIDKIIAG